MNKTVNVIMNILLAVAVLASFVMLIDMIGSFKYLNRETEDPAERESRVFEYRLEHRAYDEIMGSYYTQKMYDFSAPEGYEDMYKVAQYVHTSFMSKVYEETGDNEKLKQCTETAESLRNKLGSYTYVADDVDEKLALRRQEKK